MCMSKLGMIEKISYALLRALPVGTSQGSAAIDQWHRVAGKLPIGESAEFDLFYFIFQK